MSEAKESDSEFCPAVVCVGAVETSEQSQRKRKSRWGSSDKLAAEAACAQVTVSATSSDSTPAESKLDGDAETVSRPRKSRFTVSETAPSLAATPAPALSQEAIQQSLILQMQLKQITDRLPMIAVEAAAIEANPNRSPSPPPRYDSNGKRTNTREMRMRETLAQERIEIIEKLLKINPLYQVNEQFY